MKSEWLIRKRLKLYEIFRIVDGREEVLAIGLDGEKTQELVDFLNGKEADNERVQ